MAGHVAKGFYYLNASVNMSLEEVDGFKKMDHDFSNNGAPDSGVGVGVHQRLQSRENAAGAC